MVWFDGYVFDDCCVVVVCEVYVVVEYFCEYVYFFGMWGELVYVDEFGGDDLI